MPRYDVALTRTVIQRLVVEIEAEDEATAEKQAVEGYGVSMHDWENIEDGPADANVVAIHAEPSFEPMEPNGGWM